MNCETLESYMCQYGQLLGQQAAVACRPLHVPGENDLIVPDLLRPPFVAQQHVITAGIRTLDRQSGLLISAEMGTGKTLLSQAIIQGHAQRHKHPAYRALVFCPPHLTQKWEREIKLTVKNAHVHHINSYHDLTKLIKHNPPFGRGWWIVSNMKAKMGPKWKPAYVKGRYPAVLRSKVNKEDSTLSHYGFPYCPKCMTPVIKEDKETGETVPPSHEEMCKKRFWCDNCEEALWQHTHELDRWPVASYIHQQLPGYFRYLVIDESHQTKSADSAVGQAMGSLVAACEKVICLSGTIIGGYAWHVRPLLFRMAPQSMLAEGLGWKDDMPFNEKYGRIEKIVTETTEKASSDHKQSMGRTTSKTQKYVRPGVMPTLFGKHLIQNTVFLSLDEVADNLPQLEETVIPATMDPVMFKAYKIVERELTDAVREAMQRRDKSLLSKMLQTLLAYPDHPYGWEEIGYMAPDGHFQKVTEPENLSEDTIRPKEQAIIDFCLGEKRLGRKVWVGCIMTDTRDVNSRLQRILSERGFNCEVLRSSVETSKRELWIAKHAPHLDGVISHPQLVETGLDFFDKEYTYNIPSIGIYSPGYNLFTLRQFARRSWRIGQRELCKVAYFYYADTMQARAMALMGKKLAASTSVEGKFSSEGLAALAGDEGSIEMAMAKSLVERLDDSDVGRAWARMTTERPATSQNPPVLPGSPRTETPVLPKPAPKPKPVTPNFNRFATSKRENSLF